jgi:SAM-dependent methyltransferase
VDRFAQLSALFDPVSTAALAGEPLPPGARLWEVGCGNGSLLPYLGMRAGRVGGTVLATDLDVGHAVGNLHPPVELAVHDVLRDVPPGQHFDLIHARLVVEHTDDPARVLDRLVHTLAPGGVLVVEELDPLLPYVLDARTEDDVLVNLVGAKFTRLLSRHADVALGHRLHREFAARELHGVRSHGHLFPSRGGSTATGLMKTNVAQLADRLALGERVTNRYLALMDDPDTELMLPVFFSCRGQR